MSSTRRPRIGSHPAVCRRHRARARVRQRHRAPDRSWSVVRGRHPRPAVRWYTKPASNWTSLVDHSIRRVVDMMLDAPAQPRLPALTADLVQAYLRRRAGSAIGGGTDAAAPLARRARAVRDVLAAPRRGLGRRSGRVGRAHRSRTAGRVLPECGHRRCRRLALRQPVGRDARGREHRRASCRHRCVRSAPSLQHDVARLVVRTRRSHVRSRPSGARGWGCAARLRADPDRGPARWTTSSDCTRPSRGNGCSAHTRNGKTLSAAEVGER